MSTDHLGPALRDLVDGIEAGAAPPAADHLWAGGRRRRRTTRLVPVLAAACVAALLGLLIWPTGPPMAAVPAVGVDGSAHLTTYPSSISKPPFIEETSRPGVTAAVVDERGDARTLYAVAPSGAVKRLSIQGDAPRRSPPALSPDGRWLALDLGLVDLMSGEVISSPVVAGRSRGEGLPVEDAAWWSPDSARAFVASVHRGIPTSSGVVLGTDGSVVEVPFLAGEPPAVVAGWLDDQKILAFVEMGAGTSRLEGRTWRVGDPAWQVSTPDIEWQDDLAGTVRAGVSPDRARLLLTTQLGPDAPGDKDRTASTLVDTATGDVLGLPTSDGSLLRPDPDPSSAADWPGWGCRPAWRGQRPVMTDSRVRFAPGYLDDDLVSVSSRFGDACVAFAGNELRGAPVANHLATWQERTWVWGGRALVLLAVGGATWWVTRGRSWREGSASPRTSQPYVPQR